VRKLSFDDQFVPPLDAPQHTKHSSSRIYKHVGSRDKSRDLQSWLQDDSPNIFFSCRPYITSSPPSHGFGMSDQQPSAWAWTYVMQHNVVPQVFNPSGYESLRKV